MIEKEKLFVVAGNIDDSIKSVTPIYDIEIFPTFVGFEEYINKTPITLGMIVISEKELPFTSSNMVRLFDVLEAPFLTLTGQCLYLINQDTQKETVNKFIKHNEIDNIICYQGDLSSKYIADIITGAARTADERETEIITYRVRAADYAMEQNIKKYESDDAHYETDEEELAEVPDEPEPEQRIPSIDIVTSCYYVVGSRSVERTLFAFIEAQYLALNGKTLIIESDVDYHTLTDMATKSKASYEIIDMQEVIDSISSVIARIKNSGSKLIIIGCVNRLHYDYDFIYDLFVSNLAGFVDYFVKECDFEQTPYGSYYNIICGATVPEVLECVSKLKYDVDEDKVLFVGMKTRELGPCNITSSEMTDIVQLLLGKAQLLAQVVSAKGIDLKGDGIAYDVLSLIGRGNERQA